MYLALSIVVCIEIAFLIILLSVVFAQRACEQELVEVIWEG
jgi:hypothetical protein